MLNYWSLRSVDSLLHSLLAEWWKKIEEEKGVSLIVATQIIVFSLRSSNVILERKNDVPTSYVALFLPFLRYRLVAAQGSRIDSLLGILNVEYNDLHFVWVSVPSWCDDPRLHVRRLSGRNLEAPPPWSTQNEATRLWGHNSCSQNTLLAAFHIMELLSIPWSELHNIAHL